MERRSGWARVGHRYLNYLLIVGLLVQFWAAGWAVFGMPFTLHAALGWSLIPLSLLVTLSAVVGYGRHRMTGLSLLVCVMIILQPVLVFVLSAVSLAITALHPVNGLLAFMASVSMARRRGQTGAASAS